MKRVYPFEGEYLKQTKLEDFLLLLNLQDHHACFPEINSGLLLPSQASSAQLMTSNNDTVIHDLGFSSLLHQHDKPAEFTVKS